MSPLEHGEGASASSALIAGGVVGLEKPAKVNWRGQYNAYKGRVGDLMATGSIGSCQHYPLSTCLYQYDDGKVRNHCALPVPGSAVQLLWSDLNLSARQGFDQR